MSVIQKIVIIADTHVGDRTKVLEPALLSASGRGPDQIFHAGVFASQSDRSAGKIAPTLVVQGNRDWFLGYRLPKDHQLTINGLKVVLAHGHLASGTGSGTMCISFHTKLMTTFLSAKRQFIRRRISLFTGIFTIPMTK